MICNVTLKLRIYVYNSKNKNTKRKQNNNNDKKNVPRDILLYFLRTLFEFEYDCIYKLRRPTLGQLSTVIRM